MNVKRHRLFVEFSAFGAVLFLAIYGFAVLDPGNVGWCLLDNNDTGQHFIGGWAFLREPWRWPPGLFCTLSHPDPASISIIDAVPVMALLVKVFRGVRPEPFQYLGWWGLICFALQGGFGALLMRRIANRGFFRAAGVFFLVLSVPFLTRYPLHTALSSHFLILWALYLMLGKWNRRTAAAWTALLLLSLAIHPYLTGMCLAIYLGVTVQELIRRVRTREFPAVWKVLLNWGVTLFSALLILYLLGFFATGVNGGGNFGQTQINLNGLVNPVEWTVSAFVSPMPVLPFVENVYLGLGLFLLISAVSPKLRRLFRRTSPLWRHYGMPTAVLLAMVLFAVGSRVTLGRMVVVNFLPPQWFRDLGGVFRAAGRFAWPAWYMLAALAVGMAARLKTRHLGVALVAGAVLLQIFDLGGGLVKHIWAHHFALRETEYVSPYGKLRIDAAGMKRVCHSVSDKDFCDVGYFALKNGLVLEDYCFARRFRRSSDRLGVEKLLSTGEPEKGCIYLLLPEERATLEARYPRLRGRIAPTSARSVLIGE